MARVGIALVSLPALDTIRIVLSLWIFRMSSILKMGRVTYSQRILGLVGFSPADGPYEADVDRSFHWASYSLWARHAIGSVRLQKRHR